MADQAAGTGGGQGAGKKFVQFSRGAAQRIANVVRTVEAGNRDQGGLTFDHPMPGGNVKLIRRATFTGSWAINAINVVTFVQAPTATVSATNLSWPITYNYTSPKTCLVGKEGTSWWLVVPMLQTASASYVTGVSVGATLNTNSCAITVAVTNTTSTTSFLQLSVP